MLSAVLLTLSLAVPGAMTPGEPVVVPKEARAVDVSDPDRWVGTGTPESCTSRAVVRAVAKGGVIRFRCGPDPVTIEMQQTAKVVNTSKRVVIDGGGLVTLSGGGERRILYQNTCDPKQTWTTDHCDDQATPRLVVQHLTFADGNSTGETYEGGGGGAIFVRVAASRSSTARSSTTAAIAPGRTWEARRSGLCRSTVADPCTSSAHVHRRSLQQRFGAEQHRRLVVGLQQHLHRQLGHRPRRNPA